MRKAVLADSGPLYAAVDPSDGHHKQSHQQMRKLEQGQYEIVIPVPILLETYTLVQRRLDRQVTQRWLAEVAEAAMLNPTSEDYRQAIAQAARFEDQSITLFDATVAVLAQRLELPVWTYDHRFDVMRVPVWR